jgi:hypothetical protein
MNTVPIIHTLIYILLLPTIALGQSDNPKVVVSTPVLAVLYAGVENELEISVPGYPCESLIVAVSHGELKGHGCRYTLTFKLAGVMTINVSVLQGADTVSWASYELRAKQMPMPVAYFGNWSPHQGVFKLSTVQGIRADNPRFEYSARFQVVSFEVQIRELGGLSLSYQIEGPAFTQEVKNRFKYVHPGDTILITNINVLYPDGETAKRIEDLKIALE